MNLSYHIFMNVEQKPTRKYYLYQTALYLLMVILIYSNTTLPVYVNDNIRFQLLIVNSLGFLIEILFFRSKSPYTIFFSLIAVFFLILLSLRLAVGDVNYSLLACLSITFCYSTRFKRKEAMIIAALFIPILIAVETKNTVYGHAYAPEFNIVFTDRYFYYFVGKVLLQAVVIFTVIQLQSMDKEQQEFKTELVLKELYIEKLIDSNLSFQGLASRIEEESRIAERLKITREIHDIIGTTLTSMIMMMECCKDMISNHELEEAKELLTNSMSQARDGHDEIRNSLRKLRMIEKTHIPISLKINKIIHNFAKITKMKIEVEYTNFNISRYPQYNHVIQRFIQEGLTNSFRHGKAKKIKIILFLAKSDLMISIQDDGIGSAKIIEGIGLKGMRERITSCGGTFSYKSSSMGFVLHATLPRISGEDV